jgi:hypothetical protein
MNQTVSAIASEIGSYVRNASQQEHAPSHPFHASQGYTWESPSEPEEGPVYPEESGVEISRTGHVKLYPFTDFFKGFEKVEAVRSTFGIQTEEVLRNLKVEFFSFKFGYMAVSDVDGHLLVSTHHLKNSDFNVLYLDVIHELVHVKQFMDGRELFNSEFEYVENPTEIEAYRHAVKEAKRIGMTDREIVEYLKVEWLNEDMHSRLVESVGLEIETELRC